MEKKDIETYIDIVANKTKKIVEMISKDNVKATRIKCVLHSLRN